MAKPASAIQNTNAAHPGHPDVDVRNRSIAVATQVPFVVAPVRVRRRQSVGQRPTHQQVYVRRRVGGKLRNTQAIKLLKIAAS